jgi:phage shock protein C
MKKLYRHKEDKRIAGICGGLDEYFSIDPVLIRLAFVFIALLTAVIPMILAYIIHNRMDHYPAETFAIRFASRIIPFATRAPQDSYWQSGKSRFGGTWRCMS